MASHDRVIVNKLHALHSLYQAKCLQKAATRQFSMFFAARLDPVLAMLWRRKNAKSESHVGLGNELGGSFYRLISPQAYHGE
ncbi:hypothetical protein CGZ80_02640 [Rhodopirellula sp. MGV]|nr:hypothetical protein CGZ80_02640 [Rhodopirellula sp. MGV]PNY38486.1 hypothetical protein C2E31_00700 [Rhodopirellula baltica]